MEDIEIIEGKSTSWNWNKRKVGDSFDVSPYSERSVGCCYSTSYAYFKKEKLEARVSIFQNGNSFNVKIINK